MNTLLRRSLTWHRLPGLLALCLLSSGGVLLLAGCGDANLPRAAVASNQPGQPLSPTGQLVPERALSLDGTLNEVRQLAKESGRPVMLLFVAPWCQYCQAMGEEAFSDDRVVELSREFVTAVVVAEPGQGESTASVTAPLTVDAANLAATTPADSMASVLQVRSYPTIQFLTSDGTSLHRLTGMQTSDQLLAQMRAALHATTRQASLRGGSSN